MGMRLDISPAAAPAMPGSDRRLLALDGGGVRGLSSLMILSFNSRA